MQACVCLVTHAHDDGLRAIAQLTQLTQLCPGTRAILPGFLFVLHLSRVLASLTRLQEFEFLCTGRWYQQVGDTYLCASLSHASLTSVRLELVDPALEPHALALPQVKRLALSAELPAVTAGTLLRKVCALTQLTALVLDGRHAEHDCLGAMLLQHISVMHSLQQLCLTDVDLEDSGSDVQRLFTDVSSLQDLQLTYCRLPISLAWSQVQLGQVQNLKVCQCDGYPLFRPLHEAV